MRLAPFSGDSTATSGQGDATASGGHQLDRTRLLTHLNDRGFIQFHPTVASLAGFKVAVFLGHALYWSQHLARHEPQRRGWFFMTSRQWQDATALTPREQSAIRADCVARGWIREALAGHPARLHFKVDPGAVLQLLGIATAGPLSWEQLTPLMRDSVRFYKPLADLAGSVGGGLYLSYLLQMARQSLLEPSPFLPAGAFVINPEQVRTALCLGPKTQRNVREHLTASGLLSCGRVQHGAQLVRLNYAALIACIEAQPQADQRLVKRSDKAGPSLPHKALLSDRGTPLHTSRRVQGTLGPLVQAMGLFSSSTHPPADAAPMPPAASAFRAARGLQAESAVLSKLGGPFVEAGLPFCQNIQGPSSSSSTTTTTAGCGATEAVGEGACRRRAGHDRQAMLHLGGVGASHPADALDKDAVHALVFPSSLDRSWLPAVERALRTVAPESRQVLLDELAGQLCLPGKQIHNPPGWLLALASRQARGEAVLAMADKVAADRAQRQRHVQACELAAAEACAKEPAHTQGAAQPDGALKQRSLAQLRALRQTLVKERP